MELSCIAPEPGASGGTCGCRGGASRTQDVPLLGFDGGRDDSSDDLADGTIPARIGGLEKGNRRVLLPNQVDDHVKLEALPHSIGGEHRYPEVLS